MPRYQGQRSLPITGGAFCMPDANGFANEALVHAADPVPLACSGPIPAEASDPPRMPRRIRRYPGWGLAGSRRTEGVSSALRLAMVTRVPAQIKVRGVPRIAEVGPTSARPTGSSAKAPSASQEVTRDSLSPGTCSCSAVIHSTS
jgi:hypothetical protein